MGRARRTLLFLVSLLVSGCVVTETVTTTFGEIYAPGSTELAYCSASTYTGTTVTISGNATFSARQVFGGGLGAAPGTTLPIRQAEVRITSPSGAVVQCAFTDDAGNFSFILPQSATTYTVSVLSRSPQNSTAVQVSVLNRPALNTPYSISQTFTANATANIGTLNASATGDVVGGAFNIMEQIYQANEYLRSIAGSCSTLFTGCPNFTVAPKVRAYWMKGFDPSSYTGGSVPLSFYVPGYDRLFILGGLNGDVDNNDTDHFDNSVVLHEYAHFLEDNVFRTSSPGGYHNGDAIIDPRLAWSEGWGNFFQAAVQNDPNYRDTYGNVDGVTGFNYDADIETPIVSNDFPGADGEGNFREFSISRLLWDTIDNTPAETRFGSFDTIQSRFIEVWAALTRPAQGFLDPDYVFLNVGLLHIAQEYARVNDILGNGSNFSQVRGIERHRGTTIDYGHYVVTGAACADVSLTPVSVAGDDGSFATSDLFRNNKFYYLNLTSQYTGSLTLSYADAGGAGTESDLDLYLYNQSARFGNSADWLGRSVALPDGNTATAQTETINFSKLAAGKYLINVHVDTGFGVGNPVTYNLKLNGATLCPGTL